MTIDFRTEASDLIILAMDLTDGKVTVRAALDRLEDRLREIFEFSSSLSASPRTDGGALPVPACIPTTLPGREVHLTKDQTQ